MYRNCFILVLFCIASIGLSALFIRERIPEALDGRSPADFPNYYFAGKRFFEGRPIYGDLSIEVAETLGWQYHTYPADPPSALLLLSPLSLTEYHLAWWILFCASILCMGTAILLMARELSFSWPITLVCITLSLGSTPFLFMLYRNHYEALIVLLAVCGWRSLQRGRDISAGIFWGSAAALKLFPLLWILMLLIGRRWRAFSVSLTSFIVLVAISTLIVGRENSTQFITEVIPASTQWMATAGNYSLLSVSWALCGKQLAYLVVVAGAALLFIRWRRAAHSVNSHFATALSASLIFSPLCWFNYLVLMHPVILLHARSMINDSKTTQYLFLLLTLPFWIFPEAINFGGYWTTVIVSSLPLFAMILWSLLSTGNLARHGQ